MLSTLITTLASFNVQRHKQQLFTLNILQHCYWHFKLLCLPTAPQQLTCHCTHIDNTAFPCPLLQYCHNMLLYWFSIKFSCTSFLVMNNECLFMILLTFLVENVSKEVSPKTFLWLSSMESRNLQNSDKSYKPQG